MKKLFVAAFIAFAGLTTLESKASTVSHSVVADSVTKTPIKLEELPDAVKATLQSEPYKALTPTAAFAVKDGEKEYFQIDAKKSEEESVSLKFDKEGKPVE